MEVKGEYEITITIQNMFNSYSLTTKNSNIVTDEGLNFILQILAKKTTSSFGEVHVGTNSNEASRLDTVSTFSHPLKSIPRDRIDVEKNKLTYVINADGSDIDGTCEIGILSDDEKVLITRDVHNPYDVPNSAKITIRYSLTLTNKTDNIEEVEEEENSND